MKKITFLFCILFMISFSCNSDDDKGTSVNTNPDLLGTWKLVEQLVDPGDGSGTFQPVISDLQLEFLVEGVLKVTNGSLCSLALDSNDNSTESYSIDENRITASCEIPININFEIKEGKLLLHFGCIEGCSQKYEKLS